MSPDKAIDGILELSAEAQTKRREATENSQSFHKLTGAVLTYGEALDLLTKLRKALKSLSAAFALAALSVLTVSCSRTPNPNDLVNRLPELPPKLADNLTSTKIANVLMTKDPPPVQKASVTPRLAKQRSCVKNYDAYVVYPMTVCFPPGDLLGPDLAGAKAQAELPGWSPVSQPARYYKLSRSSAARLFCRVSGGPWYAQVTTTESCDVPDQSVLTITGAPQPLTVVWFGGINDVPPPFNPNSFAFEGETCSCCGGFTSCPDGRCVPHGVSCTINPAAKRDTLQK